MEKPGKHPLEAARNETIEALDLESATFEEVYDAVIGLLSDALDAPICLLSIVNGERQFFKANIGLDARETSRDVSFCAHAILQDENIMVVEDALKDSRFADNPLVLAGPRIRFYAGVVINAPNNLPVGTVCAIDTKSRQLTEHDRQHLMRAKILMESAISLRSMSIKDHLTGLYNRRHFDDYLTREWRRAYRHMVPLSLLMIDVDNFKNYNDKFGHPAGDDSLRRIAKAAKAVLTRPGDLLARYGGEEFVAVLPATNLQAAEVIGNRIREEVKNLKLENPGTKSGMVTVSVGGTVAPDKASLVRGPETLLATADEALYEAKRAGRDQCIVRPMPLMAEKPQD